MIQRIVSRFDGRTLYECEADTLVAALQRAVAGGVLLSGANLSFTNLSSANLSGANLSFTNLSSANLSGANLSFTNLSSANLSFTNLSGANLSFTNLSGANLSGANLSFTNLSSANLSFTNLSGANLSSAMYMGEPILSILQCSGIGSARRATVAVILADTIEITCGCFRGTLEEFRTEIEKTHGGNPRYLAEYRAAVAWIEACAAAVRTNNKEDAT